MFHYHNPVIPYYVNINNLESAGYSFFLNFYMMCKVEDFLVISFLFQTKFHVTDKILK